MALDTDPPSEPYLTGQKPLKGIGGWLILVAIGQVIGVIRILGSLLQYYTNPQTQAAFIKISLTAQGELGLNVAYAGLIIFSTYAFFAQKRYYRPL